MPTIEELRAVCSDWTTVDGARIRLGLPQSNAVHQDVKQCLKFWVGKGAIECRKAPDGPAEYRAVPGWSRVLRRVQSRVYSAMADGMTTREIADSAGIEPNSAFKALEKMRAKGRVRREPSARTFRWYRETASETDSQEGCRR